MRLLRRRINAFFGLQAILLFVVGIRALADTQYVQRGIAPLRHWLFLSGYLLLSLVFIKAWRVTRKPSPHQQVWATAAAGISIFTGLCVIWVAHVTHTFAVPGIILLLIGVATLFLIFQDRTSSEPGAAASTPAEPQTVPEGHPPRPASTSVAS